MGPRQPLPTRSEAQRLASIASLKERISKLEAALPSAPEWAWGTRLEQLADYKLELEWLEEAKAE